MARKSSRSGGKGRRPKAGLKVGAHAKAGVGRRKIKADVGTKANATM
jgi:hypothetical protein